MYGRSQQGLSCIFRYTFSTVKKRQYAKEKILAAAISEFSSHGFERAISHIARKARVNQVTVYRLFGNKAKLQLAAMLEASRLNPMLVYLKTMLAQDSVPPLSVVVPELGRVACNSGRPLISMIYFAGLQNRKILRAWENSKERNHLLVPILEYVSRLQKQDPTLRAIDPRVLSRAIAGSMLSLFSRNCLFSDMDIADQDSRETGSLLEMFERRIPG